MANTKRKIVMKFGKPTPKGTAAADGYTVGGAIMRPLSLSGKIGLTL